MTNIDQYESVFKAADKTLFDHESVKIRSVLVVTDADEVESRKFAERHHAFIRVLDEEDPPSYDTLSGNDFSRVGQLLQRVGEHNPDLICTHRNLHIPATEYPYSLGVYIDVLTQASTKPVILLPHPARLEREDVLDGTRNVMAITDHLTGDHHLVSMAAKFVESEGTLFLSHVEDEQTFERYMATVGKIPTIDTESAQKEILEQLLKEPRDYIQSCREVLQNEGEVFNVEEIVTLGHHLTDYKRLIDEHRVNLIVLNTKDEDQLAMHGLAYPLSVELRETPMLLL